MKPVIIIIVVIAIIVVGFFTYEEVKKEFARQALKQTEIGFAECNRNMKNLLNDDQINEYSKCIDKLTEDLKKFNENRLP